MESFQFYVSDDRYSVLSFLAVDSPSAEAARKLAEQMLANEHYHSLEVCSGETKLFSPSEGVPRSA